MNISPLEKKRIRNINYIMNDLHESVNNIYELLIDHEYGALKGEVSRLLHSLRPLPIL